MCAEKFEKSKEYSRTRESFDDLGAEEQAVFIAESMVNMIVKSVRRAGDAVSRAFEDINLDGNGEAESTDESKEKKKKSKATVTTAGKAKKSSSKGTKSRGGASKDSSKSKSE
ncbi:MAG: hypothetical protein BMS9Abin05_0314 [Rhodothermia bacterium]|nr:MAG: hypothetical protein BMS9Abin05_0314 [Rhodothermia bacterium]